MRQVLRGLAAVLFVLSSAPARAQQGSMQVSAAVQGITGDPGRIGGQNRLEPDFGLSWLQPGVRFGIIQLDLRGTRRGDRLHPGKTFLAVRDFKYGGMAWSLEAGDTHLSPAIGQYKFTNLFTPAVTFNGAAVTGRSSRGSLSVVAGRTSAWRNIFGSDPQTLGQALQTIRGTYRPFDWLEVSGRGSRVRTTDLREFSYAIAASDQAGGGLTLSITPAVQVAADASVVSYRRVGSTEQERDTSAMVGASWLHRRGWIQINASRFSPGDFPTLNTALPDREGAFAAGDYDLFSRLRLFAGADVFRTNLDPAGSLASLRPAPRGTGAREFGGVRLRLTSRSTLTLRAERGDRESRPLRSGIGSDSDTGVWAAEWHASVGSVTSFMRYSRRENVDRMNGAASYTLHDYSGQLFANLTRRAQIFATGLLSRTALANDSGSTYWQIGAGGQFQISDRGLSLRTEGTLSRNVDLLTQSFVPRESFSIGLNGQIARHTTIALNVNVDLSPMPLQSGTPWVSQSMLRITQSLPTGSAYLANVAASSEAAAGRGTASIVGSVFADWNANGVLDQGEAPLEGIPMRLGAADGTRTGRDGQFAFLNVPVGAREAGIDTGSLPIDFDPPDIPLVQLVLGRGDTHRLSFGVIPLGTIQGRVIRDANANGKADPGEESMNGAVVVLDAGARSEQVRGGRFRFEAVRSGSHAIKLLIESLPGGAAIKGDAEVPAVLARDRMSAEATFLVTVEKRPEIRRVFPPRGGGAAAAGTPARGRGGAAPAGAAGAPSKPSRPAGSAARPGGAGPAASPSRGRFAIQIAALSDRSNAQSLLDELKAAGLPAYITQPGSPDGGLYRIRVGPYATRSAAQKALGALEEARGEKLWVTRER